MNPLPASEQSTEPMPDQQKVNGNCSDVGEVIRLNLGGRTTHISGFKNVDVFDGPDVDIESDISDLSMFGDETVSEIYCSHALEHFPHTDTQRVLTEWCRVLKKGSKCHISVPDFEVIVRLYKTGGLTDFLRNLIWGDQIYDKAFHYTGFTFSTLNSLLRKSGFSWVEQHKWMPYEVNDCSRNVDTKTLNPISLTVKAIK
jgi:hypothetical protein